MDTRAQAPAPAANDVATKPFLGIGTADSARHPQHPPKTTLDHGGSTDRGRKLFQFLVSFCGE